MKQISPAPITEGDYNQAPSQNPCKLTPAQLVASYKVLTVFTSHQLYTSTLDEQLAQQELSLNGRTIVTAVEAGEGSAVQLGSGRHNMPEY